MNNIIGIVISLVFITGILAIGILLEKRKIIYGEGARKFIHISLCNWWFIAIFFFDEGIWAGIVPLLFTIINYIACKKNSIKIIKRKDLKNDFGPVYYTLSLLILSIITFNIGKPYIGAIGILSMGYGDGLAALIGKYYGKYEYKIYDKTKTIEGSLVVFVVIYFIILILTPKINVTLSLSKILSLAFIGTILEALTPNNLDNLTLPLGISVLYYFMT